MSSIRNTTNIIGSTFVVSLRNVDKEKAIISFALTNDNQQIYLLNFVSSSLKYQDCKIYNVFVNFS